MGQGHGDSKGQRWGWLPAVMPGVARLLAEKRAAVGADHVNECWKRGVLLGEPGWFFAREGGVAVGTPWNDPVLASLAEVQVTRTQAVLVLRDPGGAAAGAVGGQAKGVGDGRSA